MNATRFYIQLLKAITAITAVNIFSGFLRVWRLASAPAVFLFVFLCEAGTGWADENYFQVINDLIPAVSEEYVIDNGYAVYVSYDGKKILMDTGVKEKNFVRNLKAAGILLDNLDYVLLSHRHSDHISGAFHIRRERSSLPVYIPPGGGFVAPEFIVVDDHLSISPNIIVMHNHDDAGSSGIKDELSLIIKTNKGPYLFTSNSHTNFFAKLAKAKRLAGQDVYFHSGHTATKSSSKKEIVANAEKMKALNVRRVSPSHSDKRHDKIFEEVFGANYVKATLGKKVPLEPASR
jgi:metal-dependent hydrolase (beta-lactamase superfamily II)